MVMFYDDKRIQIRVNQRKRCVGQSSGSFQNWNFRLSFPVESSAELPLPAVMCDNIHRVLITRDAPQALMYRALLELKHTDMVDCLTSVSCHSRSKADTTWPKAFIIHHTVRLSGVTQGPKINKHTLNRQDIRDHLLGARAIGNLSIER